MGKASALSWSESESRVDDLRRLRQLEAFCTKGSRSSAGKSLELLREGSSMSEPDISPSSGEEDSVEEEDELEEDRRRALPFRLGLALCLGLVSKCLDFLVFFRGEAGKEISDGEEIGDPGLGERAFLFLGLAAEAAASLTAVLIMAGMLLDIAALRASCMEAMTV